MHTYTQIHKHKNTQTHIHKYTMTKNLLCCFETRNGFLISIVQYNQCDIETFENTQWRKASVSLICILCRCIEICKYKIQKYANTKIQTYKNTQIQKYANKQIHKYTMTKNLLCCCETRNGSLICIVQYNQYDTNTSTQLQKTKKT